MATAIGAVVGTVGAAIIGGKSSKDAAKTQAKSIDKASGISAEAAALARQDVFNTFSPALADFARGTQQGINALLGGQVSSSDVFTQTVPQAGRVVSPGIQAPEPAGVGVPSQVDGVEGVAQPTLGGIDVPLIPEPEIPERETTSQRLDRIDAERLRAQGPTVLSPGQQAEADRQAQIESQNLAAQQNVFGQQQPAGQAVPFQPVGGGAQGQFGAVPALAALQGGFGQARQDIFGTSGQVGQLFARGQGQALGEIRRGVEGAVGELEQFAGTGEQALQREAALSGALGPEAQQAAINAFIESPGQQFLRERQEQALVRSGAATGGLGGGRILTALQEQATGIAAGQQQQQLENLRSLAGRGQQAATTQGGFRQQGGIVGGQLIGQLTGQQAGLQTGLGTTLAELARQSGISEADLLERTGVNISNLLSQQGAGLANIRTGAGTALANIATGQGTQQANLAVGAGQAQAAGQLGVGSAIQQGLGGLANIAGQFQQAPTQQAFPQAPVNPFITQQNPLGLAPGQGL